MGQNVRTHIKVGKREVDGTIDFFLVDRRILNILYLRLRVSLGEPLQLDDQKFRKFVKLESFHAVGVLLASGAIVLIDSGQLL